MRLDAVETEIVSPDDELSDFLELVILPGIRLARIPGETIGQPHCTECGVALLSAEQKAADAVVMKAIARGEIIPDTPVVMAESTFTSRYDLFRPSGSNIILATERLYEAMQALRAGYLEFRLVQVDRASG